MPGSESLEHRLAVLDGLRRILVEELQVPRDPAELDGDTPLFVSGLGLDSLDAVELVTYAQSEFRVTLAHGGTVEPRVMRTLNTLADAVLAAQGAAALGDVGAARRAHAEAGRRPGTEAGALAAPHPAPPPPVSLSAKATDLEIIRKRVAISDTCELAVLRVPDGAQAAALDRVLPCDTRLRPGEARQSFVLDARGVPLCDLVLCREREGFVLLAEGCPRPALVGELARLSPGALDLGGGTGGRSGADAETATLCVDGPCAFALLARRFHAGIVAMPYMSFFRPDDSSLCLRAGTMGEYGYVLLLPAERLDAERARLLDLGADLDARLVGRDAVDEARLEQAFWNPRREARFGLDAVELQQQWRLQPGKAHPGAAALSARRLDEGRRMRVAFRASGELREGDPVVRGGESCGAVLLAAPSSHGPGWIGLAALRRPLAHSGMAGFVCNGADLHIVSPPFVSNLSLGVDPRRQAAARSPHPRREP